MYPPQVVDANNNLLPAVYAGEQIYIRVTFITVNLPSNAQYRIRYTVNNHTIFSPTITDGHAVIIPFTSNPPYTEFDGPFTAVPGPATGKTANQVLVTINPDPDLSFTESSYNDNSTSSTFAGISTPAKVVFNSPMDEPPTSVTAGATPFGFALTATVKDQYNNTVLDDKTSGVNLSVESGPTGSKLSGGATSMDDNDGVAVFTGLFLNVATPDPANPVTLLVSSPGLMSVISTPITVYPAQATKLVITQVPNSPTTAGFNLSTILVSIMDASGNVETSDNSTIVTASLASGAGSLGNFVTATAAKGVATFSQLVNTVAGPITIAFNSGNLIQATTMSPVMIKPGFATQLVIAQEPSTTTGAGYPFSTPPVLAEEDQYNNIEMGDSTSVVTAKLASGAGPLLGSTSLTLTNGQATFATLADSKVNSATIKFSIPTLVTAPISTPITIGKGTPTINWSPTPVVLGSSLGPAQLDATAGNFFASVPGTFTYTPAAGTVPNRVGSYPLSVTFTPTDSADYNPVSPSTMVQVGLASTPSLSVSATTVVYKNPVTFTAVVPTPMGGVTPTGSVTFLDGSTVLGSMMLDGTGRATFTTATLAHGIRSITAKYSGDSTYVPSTSQASTVHVPGGVAGGDFDGDGKADVAVFDQTNATFYIIESGGGVIIHQLGNPADVNIPVIGDFDGDGKTDLALFDQTTATFLVIESGGGLINHQLGNPGDKNIPIAGDFDGDGKTDLAIFDQTAATFLVIESGGGVINHQLGNVHDTNIPIAGDFDGDGKTDLALFDQTAATFLVIESGGGLINHQLGNAHDTNIPIAGDFDGDGKTDLALFDQTGSTFLVIESGGGLINRQLGNSGDVNVTMAGDFDGDGKTDLVVYDQTALVYLVIDSGGGFVNQQFGNKGHKMLPV